MKRLLTAFALSPVVFGCGVEHVKETKVPLCVHPWTDIDEDTNSATTCHPRSSERISIKKVLIGPGIQRRADRTAAFLGALREVVDVINDDKFDTWAGDESLLVEPGSPDRVTARAVIAQMKTNLPTTIYLMARWRGIGTTAVARAGEDSIRIGPSWLRNWDRGNEGAVVNTMAHELTHLIEVPRQPKDKSFYLDGNASDSEKKQLVSYRMGDLVQCFYEADGNKANFDDCTQTIRP